MRVIRAAAFVMVLALLASAVEAQQPAPAASSLQDRFAAAMTLEQFVATDTARLHQWHANISRTRVAIDAKLGRPSGVQPQWHLLIVAENWCSDAVNTVPHIVAAGATSGRFDVRLLRKVDASDLLERHLLDGRAATPLVLILDAQYQERGAWIERPAPLREFIRKGEGRYCEDDLKQRVRMWYEADAGATTVREILNLIEAAGTK